MNFTKLAAFTLIELLAIRQCSWRAMSNSKRKAFTLIELLVVVAIIVVLLAILTPAMDKAITQAEMMLCAANQRGTVTGVTAYAMDAKRYYPQRDVFEPNAAGTTAQFRRYNFVKWGLFANDMTRLTPYVQTKLLLDPLNNGVKPGDFEASLPNTNWFVNYGLWWDWKFTSASGGKGSTRIGQYFNWGADEFDVLTSEEDLMNLSSMNTHGSHPDAEGIQALVVLKDSPAIPSDLETLSRWMSGGRANYPRGTIDANYGFQDGSVQRVNTVEWQDKRMTKVADKVDRGNIADIYVQLPAR